MQPDSSADATTDAPSRKKNAASTTRRKKGSGGVKKVRDGVWRVDVEVDRDAVTGKRRRVSRTVNGTRSDAEVVAAKLKVADHEHRLVTGKTSARSVGAVMEKYLDAIESGTIEMAPSTVVTSRSAVRSMSNMVLADGRQFGSIRLSKLGWRDIEALYAAMKAAGRGTAWVRRCATVLSQSLEFGKKRGLLDSNPSRDAQRPRTKRTKPFSPTAEQIRDVISHVDGKDPELADMVRLLVSTGMRRGELLALRWEDIDLTATEVNVSAALVDGGKGVGIVRKATKTSDWRDIPLTSAACAVLERQRARQAEHEVSGRHGYVFAGDPYSGSEMRPDKLSERWSAMRGSSPITLQHIRHFAATAMLDAGESYRTVADILGNSESTLRLHYDGRNDVGKRQAITALELD